MDEITRTPEQWLPILAKRMDERAPRIIKLRSYTDGTSPVPELNQKNQQQWQKFQGYARINFGLTAAKACAQRMKVNGFTLQTLGTDVAAEAVAESNAAVQRIWRDNNIEVQVANAVLDMLVTSVSYLLVGLDAEGQAVITAEAPEYVYAAEDPTRPWRARAAIKVWRDLDQARDFCIVWTEGFRQKFSRPAENTDGVTFTKVSEGWTADDVAVPSSARVPVYTLKNTASKGEFEDYISVLDRIMLGILHRLIIAAYQAFKTRAFKGDLPEKDEQDQAIDWSQLLEAAPGANWSLPEGIDIWESGTADIRQLLEASKEDIREFAAGTDTPLPTLMPDSANQSAEGALFAREGVILKAQDKIARINSAISVAIAEAMRMENPAFDQTIEVKWKPAHLSTPSEQMAAAQQAKSAGLPQRHIYSEILGYSSTQIDAIEQETAAEQLQLSSMLAPIEGSGEARKVMSPEDVKSRSDSMGALIRSGVTPVSAAKIVGLEGLEFVPGLTPVTLKSDDE